MTFFFYDLETTGISPRKDRIMQFAGQRTNDKFEPTEDPYNILIKLTPDILPQPEAILLTGILPEEVNEKGISEAEFSAIFNQQIATPQTIFIGYNNLRFDDEFMRFINYRNFYDAYEWHWKDGSSRWDLLDPIRMARAIRPDGINWPFTKDDKPTNRLELLTVANGLDHLSAHDALSDVQATIEVAKLLTKTNAKFFDYLLNLRKKDQIISLVDSDKAYVYTSSHFSSDNLHTTAVATVAIDSARSSAFVYDLRHDPVEFISLSVSELTERWKYDPEATTLRLPVKTVKFNRCPAMAPLIVLNEASLKRIRLNLEQVEANLKLLNKHKLEFGLKLDQVVEKLNEERECKYSNQRNTSGADEKLYDGFISKSDQAKFPLARQIASSKTLENISFEDKRLNSLFKLYRARNYPELLSPEENSAWHEYLHAKLFNDDDELSEYQKYINYLDDLKLVNQSDEKKLKLINELEDYATRLDEQFGVS